METRQLPPHWERDILFYTGEESTNNSTTGASSESDGEGNDDENNENNDSDDDEDEDENMEDKDHLVAELYKHMEDKGTPIDKTPIIDGRDVDLYQLYKQVNIVAKLKFEPYFNRRYLHFRSTSLEATCALPTKRCGEPWPKSWASKRPGVSTRFESTTSDSCKASKSSTGPWAARWSEARGRDRCSAEVATVNNQDRPEFKCEVPRGP